MKEINGFPRRNRVDLMTTAELAIMQGVNKMTLEELFAHLYMLTTSIPAERFNKALNQLLDNLNEDDYFGTEGQLDPRGAKR